MSKPKTKGFTKQEYLLCKTLSRAQGETNDCSVIAVALVCRVTYTDAHAALKLFGRQDRRGAHTYQAVAAIEHLGCEAAEIKNYRQPCGTKAYTPITVGERFKDGYYLCRTASHFFAVVNGQVLDWSENRRMPVTGVHRIKRTRR